MRQKQSEEKHQTFTFQTRIKIDNLSADVLGEFAAIFSQLERKLFAKIAAGKSAADLKSDFIKKYQITARQFNAIRCQIEGKIASVKERRADQINKTGYKIDNTRKTIQKLEKKGYSNQLHQKKRLLFNLQKKQERLKNDLETDKIRLCFGSKKLFRAQFDLEANGYQNHDGWLKDWRNSRNDSFFLLGSKDENGGNQSCTASLNSDNSLNLRLRLPDCLASKHGKYLIFTNIRFDYGHQQVINAIQLCQERNTRKKHEDSHYKHLGLPLSYRFKRDGKGWRVFLSVPVEKRKPVTSTQKGVIGIDINAGHLALTETDRFGNPIAKKTIKLNTYGKNKNQAKALIGNACASIVEYAKENEKTLVIENLDFQKKKTQLKELSPSHARMLSSLSYNSIKEHLHSRGFRNGVEIVEVNPVFTSVIGHVKFSNRYGLSIHHSAALAISRRSLNFSERIPRNLEYIPDGKCGHVALSLPVRNRDKHVWSSWRMIYQELKKVLAAHFRAKRIRSSSSKSALETNNIPNFAGGIPSLESVTKTARLTCLDLSTIV